MNIAILVNSADETINTYQQAVRIAGQALLERNYVKPEFIEACIKRESDFPTGLLFSNNNGIAIPHANVEFVNKSSISVVKLSHGVEFGNMEDASLRINCKLIFNLALNSGEEHITILRKLIKLFQDNTFIHQCLVLNNEDTKNYINQSLTNG